MITFLHRVGWQLFLLDAVAAVFKRTQYFVRKSLASQLKKKKTEEERMSEVRPVVFLQQCMASLGQAHQVGAD